jgi:two-component system phosphate regulon sensor histidine kinase PhoR
MPIMGGRRVLRVLGSTYTLIAAICLAAGALAYYSYKYAKEMAERGEASIVDANKDVALQRQEFIDNTITVSNSNVFDLVDVANLKHFPRRWSDIAPGTRTVESVIVLNDRLEIVPDGFASKKRSKADVEAFRRLFERVILKDLGLDALRDDEVRHLHKHFDDRGYPYFLSYTRRSVGGKNYYIVVEADISYIVGQIFPEAFGDDPNRRLFQIVDESGALIYGHNPESFANIPEQYLVVLVFKTLWSWRLRMAPRDAALLASQEAARRFSDWVFVGVASVTLFVGLAILTSAIRAERRANQAKSDFIANVSHELKTPLSLIRMFGELLATGRTKGESTAREYAEIITRESERLSRLIDNVLDFARIERGKAGYDFKVGDLAEVLARGLDVYRHRLEREGMTLRLDIAEHLPPVRIDENAMTLLLLNLVDNAVKYAADGKELEVSLREDDGKVLLRVADRGPGIPADERERVFERFYRARSVRGRPVRGSGIGLAIVKHIAVAHGGDVSVESTHGGGCTFLVWLPAAPETSEERETHIGDEEPAAS